LKGGEAKNMATYTIPGWLVGGIPRPQPEAEGAWRLKVQKLSGKATLPERATEGAVGYDLHSSAPVEIPAGGRALVPTALSIGVPRGYYGRVETRLGLGIRDGLSVGGVGIDPDHRGEVRVLLFNHGSKGYRVDEGECFARLIIEKVALPEIEEVETLE
jgi:dUTP pyrophosphatase